MSEIPFNLRILATDHPIYDGYATRLVFKSTDGGMVGILAHHCDELITIDVGEMQYDPAPEPGSEDKEDNKDFDRSTKYVLAGEGFMQIINGRVTAFVETAERPDEIDEKRALDALHRAEEAMAGKRIMEDYAMTEANIQRALARISEKHKFFSNMNNVI
ncbi:MAG TPA: ATP synthase F1 subunit epsilon [Lachnospiraceae bacterium]|nr:ATP synthase F1 subunit epsilon [Lachnospiraceae bacterium]HBZ90303.1 ATP synthase F1 subunit epsilon [Lachnospiraceae bacterium]